MRKQIMENESQVSSFIKHKTHTHTSSYALANRKDRRLLVSFILENFSFNSHCATLSIYIFFITGILCLYAPKCKKSSSSRALSLSLQHCVRASERPVSVSQNVQEKKHSSKLLLIASVVHLR